MVKELYSFLVDREVEVERTEKKTRETESGPQEYEEKVKVKENVPLKVVIKKPSRRELEQADFEYSVEMSRCIKQGILTKGMLAKQYSDTGGLLTEDDSGALTDLYSELGRLESEITKSTIKAVSKRTEEDKAEINKLYGALAGVRNDIITIESSYQNLFSHTSDVMAQNCQLLWYIVMLSHLKNEEGDLVPVYKGENFEERKNDFYNREEEGEEVYSLCQTKLTTLIVYWYHSSEPSKEDFDNLLKDID